jgi:hypothetical protein
MSAPFAVIIYYRLSHVPTSDLMKRRPDPMPNTDPDSPSSRHHRLLRGLSHIVVISYEINHIDMIIDSDLTYNVHTINHAQTLGLNLFDSRGYTRPIDLARDTCSRSQHPCRANCSRT